MSEPMPSDAVLPSEPPAESTSTGGSEVAGEAGDSASSTAARKKRRRGSRGGRNRQRSNADAANRGPQDDDDDDVPELPDRPMEGQIHDPEVAERVLVPRKPQIGDTMPAPARPAADATTAPETAARRRRRRGGRGRGSGAKPGQPVTADLGDSAFEVDEETLARQRGRERKGRPIGRYLMCVHVRPGATQIAVLEGRSLIEHYVSKPADDPTQIHGNIYLGRVQNVLPGMEAAFVDIGTPKNAVLYRGDLQYDQEDIVEKGANARIEQILKARQTIVCQVTKNPIGAKGARLTQEVSLPGRSVVLIPNSSTYGISKRLNDDERKRLRGILDRVKPAQHGVIVRTAAEGISTDEIERDVARLVSQWEQIEALAKRSAAPSLLYTEPSMAVRVIREEFNREYRGVAIDDPVLFGTTWRASAPRSPTGWSTTTLSPKASRCSSATTCTSSCTKPSTARSGCRRVGRSSSSTPRRSQSST
jgi:ribonuclease E